MGKMGNPLGTENMPKHKLPLSNKTGSPNRKDALPGSIVHQRTPAAGAVPARRGSGNQVSGIDTAMSQHADAMHPVIVHERAPNAGAVPARMMGETSHDRKKSGGY